MTVGSALLLRVRSEGEKRGRVGGGLSSLAHRGNPHPPRKKYNPMKLPYPESDHLPI